MVFAQQYTCLTPESSRGIVKTPKPRHAKGMTAVISRTYHPSIQAHSLGVMTAQINDFPGVTVGDQLYLGGGKSTSPVTEVECTLDGLLIKVYRCKTETGSWYEVIATPRR